jgi:hypothetical protein
MATRFLHSYRLIKAAINNSDDATFILHTPVGSLTLDRITDNEESGYVFVNCRDDDGNKRFIGYVDQEICTFGLEVKMAKDTKEPIGFRSDQK